jgi:exosome complex component RRP43
VFEGEERAGDGGESWLFADADEFEEGLCREEISVVVDCGGEDVEGMSVKRIEKSGGGVVGREMMREVLSLAAIRWAEWDAVIG